VVKHRTGSIPVFSTKYRGMEQLVARRAHNPKVVGSSPTPATKHGGIAQLARAFGSYPKGRRFKSYFRYHFYIHTFYKSNRFGKNNIISRGGAVGSSSGS
jgi:hypothetical protein